MKKFLDSRTKTRNTKLKNDKKSLKSKIEELIMKDTSKSLDRTIQFEDEGMNTDPVNITIQEDDKLVEVKTYSDIVTQTMKNASEDSLTNSTTSIPKVNQGISTFMIREN